MRILHTSILRSACGFFLIIYDSPLRLNSTSQLMNVAPNGINIFMKTNDTQSMSGVSDFQNGKYSKYLDLSQCYLTKHTKRMRNYQCRLSHFIYLFKYVSPR